MILCLYGNSPSKASQLLGLFSLSQRAWNSQVPAVVRTSATGRSSGALLAPYGEAPGGESQDRGEVHLEPYP